MGLSLPCVCLLAAFFLASQAQQLVPFEPEKSRGSVRTRPHPHLRVATNPVANGKATDTDRNAVRVHIPLRNVHNTKYVGTVGVGSPPQNVTVVFDTGSSNLWITSSLCPSDSACRFHKTYDHSKSSTYSDVGDNIHVKFGTGFITGFISQDRFTLYGTAMFVPLTASIISGPGNTSGVANVNGSEWVAAATSIMGQRFGEITSEIGNVFYDSTFDGILGLAFPALSAYDFVPIVDNLFLQNKVVRLVSLVGINCTVNHRNSIHDLYSLENKSSAVLMD